MGAIVITTYYIYHKIISYNDLDVYTFYQGLKDTWSIIQYIFGYNYIQPFVQWFENSNWIIEDWKHNWYFWCI